MDKTSIGSSLSPSWSNEACSVCQENHKIGKVIKLCPVLYNDECLVEQINLKIIEKGIFNHYPSLSFDTIKEYFPELELTNNYGTTKVFIHKFQRWFTFRQNYVGQYYIRL